MIPLELESSLFEYWLKPGKYTEKQIYEMLSSRADVQSKQLLWEGDPYNYTTTPADYYISSSDASDLQVIQVTVIRDDGSLSNMVPTLVGQTKTQLGATPFLRVLSVKNLDGTPFAGTIYVYEDTTVTLGVPDDPLKIRATVSPGEGMSYMPVFTVPLGWSAILFRLSATFSGVGGGTPPVTKPYGTASWAGAAHAFTAVPVLLNFMDTIVYNEPTYYDIDLALDKITVLEDGSYIFSHATSVEVASKRQIIWEVRVNGVVAFTFMWDNNTNNDVGQVSFFAPLNLVDGDYIEVWTYADGNTAGTFYDTVSSIVKADPETIGPPTPSMQDGSRIFVQTRQVDKDWVDRQVMTLGYFNRATPGENLLHSPIVLQPGEDLQIEAMGDGHGIECKFSILVLNGEQEYYNEIGKLTS